VDEANQLGSGACWVMNKCNIVAPNNTTRGDSSAKLKPLSCPQGDVCVQNLREEIGTGNCAPSNYKWVREEPKEEPQAVQNGEPKETQKEETQEEPEEESEDDD
jgi:hypothetical protein